MNVLFHNCVTDCKSRLYVEYKYGRGYRLFLCARIRERDNSIESEARADNKRLTNDCKRQQTFKFGFGFGVVITPE